MKQPKRKAPFCGAASALATPFTEDGVDFPALGAMIDHQIAAGIDALVVCGTTGEAATLTEAEYRAVARFAADRISGRVPYLLGCGSPDTARAATRAKLAKSCGADGVLLVTPYYNKGTRDGIRRHFHTVADAGDLPLILYHVPRRTGVRLSAEEIIAIAAHPDITGIKEASGDMELFADLAAALGDTLSLYTGNDALLLPSLSLGGMGVISVVSNLFPAEVCAICRAFFAGDTEGAKERQLRILPLVRLLFRETNPAPLKCALALQGICRDTLRLPLSPVSAPLRSELSAALDDFEK